MVATRKRKINAPPQPNAKKRAVSPKRQVAIKESDVFGNSNSPRSILKDIEQRSQQYEQKEPIKVPFIQAKAHDIKQNLAVFDAHTLEEADRSAIGDIVKHAVKACPPRSEYITLSIDRLWKALKKIADVSIDDNDVEITIESQGVFRLLVDGTDALRVFSIPPLVDVSKCKNVSFTDVGHHKRGQAQRQIVEANVHSRWANVVRMYQRAKNVVIEFEAPSRDTDDGDDEMLQRGQSSLPLSTLTHLYTPVCDSHLFENREAERKALNRNKSEVRKAVLEALQRARKSIEEGSFDRCYSALQVADQALETFLFDVTTERLQALL